MASAAAPRPRLSRVWYLTGAMAAMLVVAIQAVVDWPSAGLDRALSWPLVAVLYAGAESAVLHFRFRRDAHSFSMGEIALTICLLTASPLHHIVGEAIGNAAAFVAYRRQSPVKAAFNLAQFTLQTVAALAVFRAVLGESDPLSVRGWAALVAGALVALAISDLTVNAAIRLSGGAVSSREQWAVRAFSALAAVMNTALGIVIVLVWTVNPAALVLAALPPVMLFLAYRAYTGQRADRSRVAALQEAAEALLGAGRLSDVARRAAQQLQRMFEVERAVAVIYPLGGSHALLGEARADGTVSVRPIDQEIPSAVTGAPRVTTTDRLDGCFDDANPSQTVLFAPVMRDARQVGYLAAIEPLSDVYRFSSADTRLVGALAGQVATVVENERLGGAVTALSELVQSKNQVLAAVGHELRSPLSAVVSAAATLESRGDQLTPGQRAELIHLIRRNGIELSAVAEDLMVASRNEESASLDVKEIDPVAEIGGVLHGMVESGRTIEVRGEAGPVLADANRFRQIVRNLVVNAGRYGGERIWIELAARDSVFEVAVVDDGRGVPEDMAEAIFEPYATAHRDRDRPQALGLGLAISRRLARSMGGDVVYRREGDLTRFSLRLPRQTASSG